MKRFPAPFPFFNQNKKPRKAFTTNPVSTASIYVDHNSSLRSIPSHNCPSQPVTRSESCYRETNTSSSYVPRGGCSRPEPVQNGGQYQDNMPRPYYSNRPPVEHNCYYPSPSSEQNGTQHGNLPLNHTRSQRPLKEIANIQHHDTSLKSTAKQFDKATVKQMPLKATRQDTRNQTRVITTSSQGVQYWSQYKTQCHLLFEIYGLLDSQVCIGEFGCQQFMLKTIDGVIKCQFWEIDQKLSRLYRGKSYRVIGTWDTQSRALKCAKVRESTNEEEKHNSQFIKISDAAMKEFTYALNEP